MAGGAGVVLLMILSFPYLRFWARTQFFEVWVFLGKRDGSVVSGLRGLVAPADPMLRRVRGRRRSHPNEKGIPLVFQRISLIIGLRSRMGLVVSLSRGCGRGVFARFLFGLQSPEGGLPMPSQDWMWYLTPTRSFTWRSVMSSLHPKGRK